MERLGSTPRSVLGALILLLALNILAWAIIAYSDGQHANDTQNWSHEKTRLLGEYASLQDELEGANSALTSSSDEAANLRSELDQRQATIADLESSLEAQREAGEDLEAIEEQLSNYREKVNLVRSELSGKTATLAARERELSKAAERLTFFSEADDLEASLEERRAQVSAELEDYRQRINLARSELSGKTATIAAREREIANLAEELSFVDEARGLEAAIVAERQAVEERRAKASAELEGYRQRINLARSELSGKTATIAAREREIANLAEELSFVDEARGLEAAIVAERQAVEERRAKASAELEGYRQRINLARSELNVKNASIVARERELANLAEELSFVEEARGLEATIVAERQTIEERRAKASAELEDYRHRINVARSELNVKNASIVAREHELANLAEELSFVEEARGLEATIVAERQTIEERRAKASAELEDYRHRINLARSELNVKNATIVARERELAKAGQQLALFESKSAEAEEQLAAFQNERKKAEAELDAKTKKVGQLDADLTVLRDRRSQVQTVLANLAQEREAEEAARGDLEGLRNEIGKMSASLDAGKKDLAATIAQHSEAETALEQTERTLAQKRQEVADLNQQIKEGEQRVAEINRTASALKDSAENAKTRLAADERQIVEGQKEIAALRREEEKARIMVAGLNARINEQRQMEVDVDQLRSAAVDAKAELDEQVRLLDQQMGMVARTEAQLKRLEADRTALDQEVQKLSSELVAKEATAMSLDEVESRLAEKENELTGLNSRQASMLGLLGSLDAKLERQRDLTEDYSLAEERLAALQSDVGSVTETLTQRQADVQSATTRLETLTGDIVQAENQISKLKTEQLEEEAVLAKRQSDVAALESRVEALTAEREAKQAEIAEAESRFRKIQGKMGDINARINEHRQMEVDVDQLRSAAVDAKAELDEQVRLLDQQMGMVARTEAQLKRLEADRTALDQEVQRLSSELVAKEATAMSLDDVESRLAEKENELIGLNSRQASMLGLLGSLDAKLERQRDLTEDYSLAEERLAALQSDVGSVTETLTQRQADVQSATTRLETLTGDIVQAENQISKLKTEQLEEEAVLAKRQSDVAALESRVEALTAEREAKRAEIAEAESRFRKIQGKMGDIGAAEAELGTVTSSLIASEADLKAKQASIDEAESRLGVLEDEIKKATDAEAGQAERLADLESKIDEAGNTLKDLDGRKGMLTADVDLLEETLRERKSELAKTEQALTSAGEAKTTAEGSLEQIRAELEGDRAALERMRQGNDSAAKEAEALKGTLSALETEVQEVGDQRDAAVVELESLQLDVEKAKVDLAARESALLATRAELAGLVKERDQLLEDAKNGGNTMAASNVDPLLSVLPVQTESGLRIAHLLFNHSSAELSPGAARKVREAATWIMENQAEKVRLIGYADATGSREANVRLSEARARETAGLLGRLGIAQDVIEIEAVGEDVLIEATGNRVAEPLNRSVGIFVGE